MIRFFRGAVLALLLVPTAGTAQNYTAGMDAVAAGDYATALRELTPFAERGDAPIMYAEGQGVQQDDAEAVKWYQLAAKQGHAIAQAYLGLSYAQGKGAQQDNVTAHMWLNLGAANGPSGIDKKRDAIGQQMSQADLSEAQRRARVCLASSYQDCD